MLSKHLIKERVLFETMKCFEFIVSIHIVSWYINLILPKLYFIHDAMGEKNSFDTGADPGGSSSNSISYIRETSF